MIGILFSLLAILVAIEASTSLARASGFIAGSPYAGLSLQSSLSIISRFVIFLYSPLFGYLADTNRINSGNIVTLPYCYLLLPMAIGAVSVLRVHIIEVYSGFIRASVLHGVWLKRPNLGFRSRLKSLFYTNSIGFHPQKPRKLLSGLLLLTTASYVPYYAAWPITIIAIASYPEYRATLLTVSTVFTAVNTILLTLWLDPVLVRMLKCRNLSISFYFHLLSARLVASGIVGLFLFLARWHIVVGF